MLDGKPRKRELNGPKQQCLTILSDHYLNFNSYVLNSKCSEGHQEFHENSSLSIFDGTPFFQRQLRTPILRILPCFL